jgi:hypothetical protein
VCIFHDCAVCIAQYPLYSSKPVVQRVTRYVPSACTTSLTGPYRFIVISHSADYLFCPSCYCVSSIMANICYVVGFELRDVALPVTICVALIATFILRRRRIRRVATEVRSNLPVLPNGKILPVDPNKDREFGSEYSLSTVGSFNRGIVNRMDCCSVHISSYLTIPR